MGTKTTENPSQLLEGLVKVAAHCQTGGRHEVCGGLWGTPNKSDTSLAVCQICHMPVPTQATVDACHVEFGRVSPGRSSR
jgi:hypothetical protein